MLRFDRAPQLLLPEHDREPVRLEQAPVVLRSLHPVPLPAGQVLSLWAWSDADPTPRLVGRSPNVQSADIALARPAEDLLGKMTHLGVAPADAGPESPTAPTAPFLAEGPCAKVW